MDYPVGKLNAERKLVENSRIFLIERVTPFPVAEFGNLAVLGLFNGNYFKSRPV